MGITPVRGQERVRDLPLFLMRCASLRPSHSPFETPMGRRAGWQVRANWALPIHGAWLCIRDTCGKIAMYCKEHLEHVGTCHRWLRKGFPSGGCFHTTIITKATRCAARTLK